MEMTGERTLPWVVVQVQQLVSKYVIASVEQPKSLACLEVAKVVLEQVYLKKQKTEGRMEEVVEHDLSAATAES
jgi:DTW domain-containing protein YfiP